MPQRTRTRTLAQSAVGTRAVKRPASELQTAGRTSSSPSPSSARPRKIPRATTAAPRKREARRPRKRQRESSDLSSPSASPTTPRASLPITALPPCSPQTVDPASPPLSSLPPSPQKAVRVRSPLPFSPSSSPVANGQLPSRRRHYPWEIESDQSDPDQEEDNFDVWMAKAVNGELSPPVTKDVIVQSQSDTNACEYMMIFSDEETQTGIERDASQLALASKLRQREARDAFPVNEGVNSVCYIRTLEGGYLPGYIQSVIPLEDRKSGHCCIAVTRLGKAKKYRRSDILFPSDPAFGTCALATWVWRPKVLFQNDAQQRLPTPPPGPSPEQFVPSPAEFARLDRVSQLRCIRPHLHRIIMGDYPPAMWRINLFFDGNQNGLLQMVRYGNISEHEVGDVVLPELERWALRAARWLDYPEDTAPANRSEEPPRPAGSKLYEDLSPKRRRDFIADVLLPEAIIHLLIVSEGFSQDPAHEEESYKKALDRISEPTAEPDDDDDESSWDLRTATLSFARRREREKRGLYPDHFSREEIDEWEAAREEQRKVFKTLKGRRLKKKVDSYKE